VPAPPPPHLVKVEIPVAEVPPPVVDPGAAAPPAREKPPTAKPATPPPVAPPPATTPPDPPVLQTTRNPDELESRARSDLIRTNQILDKIVPEKLPREAQESYAEARRFKRLAEDDLRDKNFAAAASNALKALTFAQALTKTPTT
jgi:hypothetical protein